MHGLILQAARDLVVQKFGSKLWKKITTAAHVPEDFETQKVHNTKILESFSLTNYSLP